MELVAYYEEAREILELFGDDIQAAVEFAKTAPVFITEKDEAEWAIGEKRMIRFHYDHTQESHPKVQGGSITTSYYQNWKVVALLRGFGFENSRTEDGDDFYTPNGPVVCVYDAWEPSKDGSRLMNWSELSDPTSPQCGRRYITAYLFWTPEGYADVIAWSSSPHSSDELYHPIALSSWEDWKRAMDRGVDGLSAWLLGEATRL